MEEITPNPQTLTTGDMKPARDNDYLVRKEKMRKRIEEANLQLNLTKLKRDPMQNEGYELNDLIKYDNAAWGNKELDRDVKILADTYGIKFPGGTLLEFTDRINLLINADNDRRKYRKTLQVFELCDIKGNVKIPRSSKIKCEPIEVDEILLKVFHNLKYEILSAEFIGYTEEEARLEIEELAETERREEIMMTRKIITELIPWLWSRGIFVDPVKSDDSKKRKPENIGNREGAFIYDVVDLIGYPIENIYHRDNNTNKTKRDAVRSYLRKLL